VKEEEAYLLLVIDGLYDKLRRLEIELQSIETRKELASYSKPERTVYPSHYLYCDMGR